MKITTRCGEATVEALVQALLAKAAAAKAARTDKVRADTTVLETNVAYPTDSRLLTWRPFVVAGGSHPCWDRRRAARRKAHEIGAKQRLCRDEALATVLGITGELANRAEMTAADAEAVLRNDRRGLRRAGAEASGCATWWPNRTPPSPRAPAGGPGPPSGWGARCPMGHLLGQPA